MPILGGDFSASIGILLGGPGDEDDDVDLLGGAVIAEMKKAHGLCNGYVQMGCASPADRNMLTLHTAGLANVRVTEIAILQIDFTLSNARVFVESVWNDFVVPIGLDHRCVHCIMSFKKLATTHKRMNRYGMKN